MFKKLLSNLPFNPSLIGKVSFYTSRIKRESSVRRLGLIFTSLAMVIQVFAVISPPEPTLAESPNDMIRGGFSSRSDAVKKCKADVQGFKDALAYFKVTCDALAKAQENLTLKSTQFDGKLDSMGRTEPQVVNPKTGKKSDKYEVPIGSTDYWMKNLTYWDSGASSSYKVLKVKNSDGVYIYVMYDCGNIVTVGKYTPPKPPPKDVCPNIAGIQTKESQCDVCPNRSGIQTSKSECDVCPNITGTQNSQTSCDVCPDKPGVQTRSSDCDVCPNRSGIQITLDECDVCPNKEGVQSRESECDVCPNRSGVQLTEEECDVCPNIPGQQDDADECYPCPEARQNNDAAACLDFDKKASNQTKNISDANGTTAGGGDVIVYSLSVKNTGSVEFKDFVFEENVNDILEYADITDFGGGQINQDGFVTWPKIDIGAGQTITKKLTIKVKNPIPQTPASSSDPGSFDLTMTNVFYDKSININLPCKVNKCAEIVTTTLPNTGPGTSLAIGFSLFAIMGYFLARNRLMVRELELVKQEFAGGI